MKIVKSEILDFLAKVSIKELVQDFVLEENGAVGALAADSVSLFARSTGFKGFGKRIGISNLSLLIKMFSALEAADNTVNVDIKGSDMVLATRNGKYTFKLTDADAIPSVMANVSVMEDAKKAADVRVVVDIDMIGAIKKSISVLAAGDKDTVSFFVEDGKLMAVIKDEATKCTSSVELGSQERDIKLDFEAGKLGKILDMSDKKGMSLYLTQGQPLFIASPDGSFTYGLSCIISNEMAKKEVKEVADEPKKD